MDNVKCLFPVKAEIKIENAVRLATMLPTLIRAMYKCSKCLRCTSDISWLVIHVYGHWLIIINSGQMYVYVKRQNVHC